MSIAVYAGTFDPITLGHLSVVRKAAGIFGHVRILVAINPDKSPMFTPDERVSMIAAIVAKMPHVTVDSTSRYVVEYARDIGARFLVRGVRGATDAVFETTLAQQNRTLAPEIDTVLLPADADLSEVSSSELKRRVERGDDVSAICPDVVAVAIRERIRAV
jgi:pantetheine-phosphate adenylyltransferase